MAVEQSIGQLIICSAYREPEEHWEYDSVEQGFKRVPGRRRAAYLIASQGDDSSRGEGQLVPLDLVNLIRPRVKAWREAGYPGSTAVTRKLIEWWRAPDARDYPFFFCELDAIETLIWLVEAPDPEKVGVNIPSDGSLFRRLCTKLCTGGGKTIVMSMLIAWMVCNKATYPGDRRFSKDVLVMAPGLTVRDRLRVLELGGEGNYYMKFNVVPIPMRHLLRQGKVIVRNWQSMTWETEEQIAKKKTVDKRGALSDAAYVRSVIGDMSNHRNLLVINDEAHHAWRTNPEVKVNLKGEERREYIAEQQQATAWMGALDRIHRVCGINTCFDFSATPFSPSGNRTGADSLYGWIVSDFSLNDGIESGLVKTPRLSVGDDTYVDGDTGQSRLLRIYAQDGVRDSLNADDATEATPLPHLVVAAYSLLAADWKRTYDRWEENGSPVPPVMISVVNRTETSARVQYMFDHGTTPALPDELTDKRYTVRIDSKLIASLEDGSRAKSVQEEELREKVATVGQPGKPGEDVRHIVSVGMLSEGWDCHTVTSIMGLRAFTSQLLCEQVIGRGLRRVSYDVDPDTGLFRPEYVTVMGIPMQFLPHEGGDGDDGGPDEPRTMVNVVQDRGEYEISWPNVVRVNRRERTNVNLDPKLITPLLIDTDDLPSRMKLASVLQNHPDMGNYTLVDLKEECRTIREQTLVFRIATNLMGMMKEHAPASMTEVDFLPQAIRCIKEYIDSDSIAFNPPLADWGDEDLHKAFLILAANDIVQHVYDALTYEDASDWVPVIDDAQRVRSTKDMATWYTKRECHPTRHSHISQCVTDSGWEGSTAEFLDQSDLVQAWVKNDAHIGFTLEYRDQNGSPRTYIPDFLIRLTNGTMLILETKGRNSADVQRKRKALQDWVAAVNATNEYGHWEEDINWNPREVDAILRRHAQHTTTN
ncbi:type III restriction-modification system, res subunit [Bifidobacterium sp. DSM 109959]|uniref:Type III restriction-modification system, res subunit n=1 Tax=Bifidobacterium olomucense TaxID=2675324 RepID=A0A7Y0EWY7_9BIFI|nr:DEAD/DEAH box helicase family protein [Bifidobacterium sp. DSM 109959]NMM97588.1 type III restriction-modification system, res subunit [Bifidobacterium sp. DSM 109959]